MADLLNLTLGQLSVLTEIPERTLRLYRTKGLLDPPTVRGRVGYYADAHVRQLRVVKAMAARGFPLAEIAKLTSRGLSRTSLMLLLDAGGGEDIDANRPMDTVLASVSVERVTSVNPELIPKLLARGILHRDSAGELRVDSLGVAIISDLTRAGFQIEEVAEFASAIADLAAEAREVVERQLHPTLHDADMEAVLVDAATALFRETLRNERRP